MFRMRIVGYRIRIFIAVGRVLLNRDQGETVAGKSSSQDASFVYETTIVASIYKVLDVIK